MPSLKNQDNELLDGAYQLLGMIGSGGMATVYEARAIETGRIVAIKVLLVDPNERLHHRQHDFFNELLLSTRVRHPRIVEVLDFGVTQDDAPYIVMERLYGHALFYESRQAALAPSRALDRLLEVCDGIEAAHGQGIVHADINSMNLFLNDPNTERESTTILDFGLARKLGRDRRSVGGTPGYTPPEYLRGEPIQPQGDIYQLGMVFAEMLAGKPLLKVTTMQECLAVHARGPVPLPFSVTSSAFRSAIETALAPDPKRRFKDIAALRDALIAAGKHHGSPSLEASFAPWLDADSREISPTVRFNDSLSVDEISILDLTERSEPPMHAALQSAPAPMSRHLEAPEPPAPHPPARPPKAAVPQIAEIPLRHKLLLFSVFLWSVSILLGTIVGSFTLLAIALWR